MKFLFSLLLLCSFSFANFDSTAHFYLKDATGTRWAAVRLTLAESLQVTDLGPTHIQSSTWARLHAYGEFTPKWTWTSRTTVYTDMANRTYAPNYYEPDRGIPYNTQDSGRRTWDYITAQSIYKPADFIALSAGLDYLRFGPAYRNPLGFRGEQDFFRPWQDSTTANPRPAPLLFLGFDLNIKWLRYEQYSGETMHTRGYSRYFHTHRLTADLPLQSEFSLFETQIYGTTVEAQGSNPNRDGDSLGRSMEWLYAMPFVPYFFAQHYIGDRDNGSMGMSGVFRGIPKWEAYFEYLMDDGKSPLSMFDDSWWGNKWALTAGLNYHRNYGPVKSEWRLEWTRIEPWVYTHHLGASHQYTHYGQILGSDLGPNSQEFYTHYELALAPVRVRLSYSSVAKDNAFGSHVTDIHTPTDPTTRKFLNPATTRRYDQLGGEIWFDLHQSFWLKMGGWQYLGDYKGIRAEGSFGVTW